MLGVFELYNAKKHWLGSELTPYLPIPLYPIGHQRCFWIPVVVFELHNVKKIVRVLWWRPEHPKLCTL